MTEETYKTENVINYMTEETYEEKTMQVKSGDRQIQTQTDIYTHASETY